MTAIPQPALRLQADSDLRVALFSERVMTHPAKQSLPQLAHILKRLSRDFGIAPGSNLLDCFGGTGALMLACSPLHGGHNVCTVELAAHFRAIQTEAWQHFSRTLDMADMYDIPPGEYLSLAGDSRRLIEVLSEAEMQDDEQFDCVVSSPPYVDAISPRNGIDPSKIKSTRGLGRHSQALLATSYDAIITSPSYGGSESVDERKTQNTTIAHHAGGNLARARYDSAEMAKNGDMPKVDALVTSPPYQDAMSQGHTHRKSPERDEAARKRTGNNCGPSVREYAVGDAPNIGNERGKKYLASMAEVWQSCAEIVRPGGLLVCITRDCVQRGKRVLVGEQNRALLEAAGFRLVECENWQIPNPSFWRILQAKKARDRGQEPIMIADEQVQYFIRDEPISA